MRSMRDDCSPKHSLSPAATCNFETHKNLPLSGSNRSDLGRIDNSSKHRKCESCIFPNRWPRQC
jgi:hypothetical protein